MAYINFFSETGFPHAGVMAQADTGRRYRYYGLNISLSKGGYLDRSVRRDIFSFARFPTTDADLNLLDHYINHEWNDPTYIGGVQDCVSFAADIARQFGLRCDSVNFSPANLVSDLATMNSGTARRVGNGVHFPCTDDVGLGRSVQFLRRPSASSIAPVTGQSRH